ncbi:hypothetical protein AGABI1DRAFT_115956 [Agaricus bisporus var. burnettii JB137-S8]|uniref:ubiquitinyl hydrolase 1 n=1 Tax=Agaricus bisporus var. burnettii (strain JB137-S8 / ATCC MYA-4627 / FGSC 10392) TaxID=597362 RepID=K5X015_AGABU|nr:uncharacterized protein AGABI1DRAFT_115956 [Agaricus bisporus var. burnettii JB137-S8]EKM76212.1 hypothetical protein AGABI1DRAFT_115956 [Agaricus bisporus var. burnettii JB137-S8]
MSQSGNTADVNQATAPEEHSLKDDLKDLQFSEVYDLNQRTIEDTYADGPLIQDVAPLSLLRSEYEANDNHVFVKEIDWLINNGYHDFRRVKGDGDCFYRAIGFAFFTRLIQNPDKDLAVVTTLSTLMATANLLEETGIEKLVYEDFYTEMEALIRWVVVPREGKSILTIDGLLEYFRDPEGSNVVVVYLRLVTASYIKAHVEDFENFLFHPETRELMSVPDYCNRVMGLGKEADHVEIMALCDAFRWNVEVAYLGGHSKDAINFVKIPDAPYPGFDPVFLLYRPGHYDILLK